MMLSHLLLIAVCVLFVEVALRFRIADSVKEIVASTSKSSKVISSKEISDHWKEKIVPVYALVILRNSLKIVAVFASLLLLFLVLTLLDPGLVDLTLSYTGIAESLIIAYLYFKLRNSTHE